MISIGTSKYSHQNNQSKSSREQICTELISTGGMVHHFYKTAFEAIPKSAVSNRRASSRHVPYIINPFRFQPSQVVTTPLFLEGFHHGTPQNFTPWGRANVHHTSHHRQDVSEDQHVPLRACEAGRTAPKLGIMRWL